MATTSLWPIHNTGSRGTKAVVKQLVDYAENQEKTVQTRNGTSTGHNVDTMKDVVGYATKSEKVDAPGESSLGPIADAENDDEAVHMVMNHLSDSKVGMRYVTGINCSPEHAVEEMMITKNRWPDRGNRLLFHGYQSFLPGEVTPDQAHRIGVHLARELWGDRFEVVVATHLDRDHLHSHFVINTVSFLDGRKFNWDVEYPRMQKLSDVLCRAEKLSVVQSNGNLEMKIHRGAQRAEYEGRPTIQSIVKEDVDCCIKESSTLEEWMALMREKGYQIDDSHKYLRIFPYGHSKCIRLDRRFGEAYSLDGIASQIAEQKMGVEVRPKTEEEAIREIYRELYRGAKRRHKPMKRPRGMQMYYMRFMYRIGYHKSPAQIARTHYILREELTKLDHYIEESKFLIYEDISTLDELKDRRNHDQIEVNRLYRSKINFRKMIPVSTEEEKEAALGQIKKIDTSIRKLQKNLQSEKRILKRMGEMQDKEKKADMILSGMSLGNPFHRNHSRQKERELNG